jgi:hypothetical protein
LVSLAGAIPVVIDIDYDTFISGTQGVESVDAGTAAFIDPPGTYTYFTPKVWTYRPAVAGRACLQVGAFSYPLNTAGARILKYPVGSPPNNLFELYSITEQVAVGTGIGSVAGLLSYNDGFLVDPNWVYVFIGGGTPADGTSSTVRMALTGPASDTSLSPLIVVDGPPGAPVGPGGVPIPPVPLPPPPGPTDPWPLVPNDPTKPGPLPNVIAPVASAGGSSTVLQLVRDFSAATRRAVRLTSSRSIEMVPDNTPLPAGWVQADAVDIYHSSTQSSIAGIHTLSLESADLALTASATLVANDVRLLLSGWKLPEQLPVYSLNHPAPVARVTHSFTRTSYRGSVEFLFPVPSATVRR